ncbi:hypothetical protein DPMN_006738 [Dreissena polymorpha]|uniref:DNA helicase Pif1-like 2B domain-containing protein n=1 Tax=Dreissena polymorpha TaxID=45954 RepID=A0A9D4RXR4_DREPO|nr:hypothetical protein DPMN_006738 [Dreissena polymorpha]
MPFPTKNILKKIMRKRNEDFAKVINEVSTGNVSELTLDSLETVNKSTRYDSPSSVKLFANNFLVDTYNRRKLLEASGDITEFKYIDKGEKRHLINICDQPTLGLKDGSSVILLRNLSSSLVNGLTGTVVGFDSDGPIVKFPSVNITTTIKKLEFSGKFFFILTLQKICIGIVNLFVKPH